MRSRRARAPCLPRELRLSSCAAVRGNEASRVSIRSGIVRPGQGYHGFRRGARARGHLDGARTKARRQGPMTSSIAIRPSVSHGLGAVGLLLLVSLAFVMVFQGAAPVRGDL